MLSACETGRGENVRGEGLVGLTRALQGAYDDLVRGRSDEHRDWLTPVWDERAPGSGS